MLDQLPTLRAQHARDTAYLHDPDVADPDQPCSARLCSRPAPNGVLCGWHVVQHRAFHEGATWTQAAALADDSLRTQAANVRKLCRLP